MSDERKAANADAKAAKAKAKSLRPWFKKKRFVLPIALVAIIVVSNLATGSQGDDKAATDTTPATTSADASEAPVAAEPEKKEDALPGIGAAAVDGKFTFTVNGVTCGLATVGDTTYGGGATAQGQYCKIAVTITNTGDKAQTLFGDNQKLVDAAGREFSPDTTAMIYDAPAEGNGWMSEINPGNTLTANVIFDVPADATLEHIELHDSMFSKGVKVALQ